MDRELELGRLTSTPQAGRLRLESRLRYHLRCLREDATDPALTSVERLALVRDRAKRIREIQRELEMVGGADPEGVPKPVDGREHG